LKITVGTDALPVLEATASEITVSSALHADIYSHCPLQCNTNCSWCRGLRYGDGASNAVEENSSIFSLIRMH